MGHSAAFRVLADQFDDDVQSIGANRRCPRRKATPDRDELGRLMPELVRRRPNDMRVRTLQADAHAMLGHKDSAVLMLDALARDFPERSARFKAKADSLRQ